jgi:hypothetical protein
MRCPSCGGLNRAGADWCGQCLRRFTAPPAPAPEVETAVESLVTEPSVTEPSVTETPAVTHPVASAYAAYIDDDQAAALVSGGSVPNGVEPAPASSTLEPAKPPPPEMVGKERGAFKVKQEGIVWTCKSCDNENPLALQVCSVCGTAFADTIRDKEDARPERDPGTVAMLSLFMPGAGHAYMGMWGQAIARGILQLWVLFTALMGALQKGSSSLIVIVFGLSAVAFWVLAAHDAYREATHEPNSVILKGRMFMYVVLALLMLLIVLLMGAGMKAA